MDQEPHRHRWYQFRLAEVVFLLPLLAAVWLYSAREPVLMYHFSAAEGGTATVRAWPGPYIEYETSAHKPTTGEIIDRGLRRSTIAIVAWVGGLVVLRTLRRTPAPQS